MGLLIYKKCNCCGETFHMTDIKEWKWKLAKGEIYEYYCTFKCYSKEFDKKYKSSKVSSRVSRPTSTPVELERVLRSGRR